MLLLLRNSSLRQEDRDPALLAPQQPLREQGDQFVGEASVHQERLAPCRRAFVEAKKVSVVLIAGDVEPSSSSLPFARWVSLHHREGQAVAHKSATLGVRCEDQRVLATLISATAKGSLEVVRDNPCLRNPILTRPLGPSSTRRQVASGVEDFMAAGGQACQRRWPLIYQCYLWKTAESWRFSCSSAVYLPLVSLSGPLYLSSACSSSILIAIVILVYAYILLTKPKPNRSGA